MALTNLSSVSSAMLGQWQGSGSAVNASAGADNGGGFGAMLQDTGGQPKQAKKDEEPRKRLDTSETDSPTLLRLFSDIDQANEAGYQGPRHVLDLSV